MKVVNHIDSCGYKEHRQRSSYEEDTIFQSFWNLRKCSVRHALTSGRSPQDFRQMSQDERNDVVGGAWHTPLNVRHAKSKLSL